MLRQATLLLRLSGDQRMSTSRVSREYQGTLEDATARSLHHAGARSIGAVSATRVRLPVVQRAPVDGRVDEIGAPLQQSASDAVRHHLGGQRERLQKLFPPPSIRIEVKASTCHQRSSEVIRGHQRSSEVIRGHQRSSEVIRGHQRSSEVIQVKASTCQARRANQASSGSHLVPRCRGDPQPRRCPSTQSDVIRGNQTSSKGVPRRSSTTSMPIRSHQRDARSTARACSTAESRARSTSSSKPDRAA